MKIIQLSDLHLIENGSESLYGINPNFRLKEALKSIQKNHSDAKFIVITGDLTDNASSKAYEILSENIKNSLIPVYMILGNHDKRDVFNNCFPDFIDNGFCQYIKKVDNTVHIFLDTLVEDKPYGELCSSRMKWLKKRLDEFSEDFVYLYMHHHPISSGLYEMDNMADFKSTKEFWSLLKNYKNVKHISFGHLHRVMHSSKQNISLHSTRSTTFQVAYKPDTKTEYLTNEEHPTYAVIDIIEEGNTRIHHHEFMNEDRFFLGDY
ncbi:MAG TPA: phosphodiesterase [Sulfurospirillum arcachonense]|nr:phosphodiesterase [Sulfurospirillum arcachonense]